MDLLLTLCITYYCVTVTYYLVLPHCPLKPKNFNGDMPFSRNCQNLYDFFILLKLKLERMDIYRLNQCVARSQTLYSKSPKLNVLYCEDSGRNAVMQYWSTQ